MWERARADRNVSGSYRTLSSEVYDTLKMEILTCKLKPGEVIFEKDLCRRLGVSQHTVRVALTQLEQEGLMQTRPSLGHIVTPLTAADVEEIYEMRRTLENRAIELACERITARELAELERASQDSEISLHEGATDDQIRLSWHRANINFHLMIAEFTGNQRLARAVLATLEETVRLHLLIDLDPMFSTASHHAEIVAALRQRDAARAKEIAMGDLDLLCESVMRVLSTGVAGTGGDDQRSTPAGD